MLLRSLVLVPVVSQWSHTALKSLIKIYHLRQQLFVQMTEKGKHPYSILFIFIYSADPGKLQQYQSVTVDFARPLLVLGSVCLGSWLAKRWSCAQSSHIPNITHTQVKIFVTDATSLVPYSTLMLMKLLTPDATCAEQVWLSSAS